MTDDNNVMLLIAGYAQMNASLKAQSEPSRRRSHPYNRSV